MAPPVPGSPRLPLLLAAFLCSLVLLMWGRDLRSPWIGEHEYNGALYAGFARNHLRYGLGETLGLNLYGVGPRPPEPRVWYLNHPPLFPHLLALSFLIVGESEMAARAVAILSSTGVLLFLLLWARRLEGPWALAAAAAACLSSSAFLYFGRVPEGGLAALLFALWHLWLHPWLDPRLPWSRSRIAGLAATGLLSGLSSWVGVELQLVLFLGALAGVLRSSGGARRTALLAVSLLLVLAACLLLPVLFIPSGPRGPWAALGERALGASGVSPLRWASRVLVHRLNKNFTLPVLGLSLWGIAVLARRSPEEGDPAPRARRLLLVLVTLGLLHLVLFNQAAWYHNYWSLFLLPFLVLGSVVGMAAIVQPRRWRPASLVLLVLCAGVSGERMLRETGKLFGRRHYRPEEVDLLKRIDADPALGPVLWTGMGLTHGEPGYRPELFYYLREKTLRRGDGRDGPLLTWDPEAAGSRLGLRRPPP